MFINRNYFLIWFGKFVSMIGDRFHTLVLALWILERKQSPMLMGIVLLASTLPAFVIGLFSGTYVDMKNKKHIIVIADLVRGGLILTIAYLEYMGLLGIMTIIAVSMAISIMNAFFDPAVKALVPEVVDKENLAKANGMEQLINGVSSIIGPLLGAIALGTIGFVGGFLINGLSFIISAVSECFIDAPFKPREIQGTNRFFEGVKDGFSYVIGKETLKKVLIIIAVAHFAVGSFTLIMPFLAERISDNTWNLGLLQAFFGMGMVLGGTLLNMSKSNESRLNLLVVYVSLLGFSYASIALLRYLEVAMLSPYLVVLMTMGITISNAASFWQLILQLDTPETYRGRIFSLVSVIANISFPISFGLIGILLEVVDFEFYLAGMSLIMVVLSILWRNVFNENREKVVV